MVAQAEMIIENNADSELISINEPAENEVFNIDLVLEDLEADEELGGTLEGKLNLAGGANETQAFVKASSDLEVTGETSGTLKADMEVYTDVTEDMSLLLGAGYILDFAEAKAQGTVKVSLQGGDLPEMKVTGNVEMEAEEQKGSGTFEGSF